MDTDTYPLPPPPPPPSFGAARPPLSRVSSWQRVSPLSQGEATSPPPPPFLSGNARSTDRGGIPAASPRSSRSSFVVDGDSAEPRSSIDQFTPEMIDMLKKFVDAGGYEGIKRIIVEEVGEQLKSDNSDGDSLGSSPSPPPPPTGLSRPPPPPGKPLSPTSGRRHENSFSKSPPFGGSPSGPSLPHTPPASPRHGPQEGRLGGMAPPNGAPRPYQTQAKPVEARESKLSPVDRCWGELYDTNGKATKRLGQILRGVANYLISQTPTPENVVVSPNNLAAFYAQFSVDNEPHPYSSIFRCQEGDKKDYRDISELYDDLDCEYHLIKRHTTSRARPTVPALTPAGFVKWFTMAIYAYPDEEAARLDAVMSRLPIDADGDGKPERLPKQLSRYLLPSKQDKTARQNLDEAVKEVLYERRKRSSYGTEGIKSRPENRRSESAPIAQTRESTRVGDEEAEEQHKKRPTKNVSFGRVPSKKPEADGGVSPARSRRTSSDRAGRAGRPYNFLNGVSAIPATSERSSNDADPISPTSPLPSPASPHFELSSGRDRPETKRYSRDAAPRRASSPGDEVPRSANRQRRRRNPEVVVEQDKGPNWMQILREVSSIYD